MKVRFTFLILLFIVSLQLVYSKEKIQYPALPVHYDIDAQLEPAENKITVSADVTLTAARDSFSEIILGFERNFTMSSVMDSNGTKLKFKGKTGKDYTVYHIAFPPGEKLKKGDQFKIKFHYSGKIDYFISKVNIITEKLTELGQAVVWFPRELDYSSTYTYSYKITAPKDQTIVVSNVHVKLEEKKPVGDKVQWTFSSTGEKSWTLILLASNGLKEYKKTKNNIKGSILYVDPSEEEIKKVFDNIISILDTYNELFGPYSGEESFNYFLVPRKGWSYVRGETVFMPQERIVGALQPDGMLNKGIYKYLAHELAHLWWGMAVIPEPEEKHPNADWMNEGFAEFSSFLALEKILGKDSLYDILGKINKRILELPVKIPVSEAINDRVNDWKHWRTLSYYKPAYLFYMLRHLVGDRPFFAQLKTIFRENMGKKLTTTQMLTYFQGKYGKQVDTFIRQFIMGSDCPEYHISYSVSGAGKNTRIKGKVTQQTGIFEIPLELRFFAEGKSKTIKILVDKKQVPFTVELEFEPEDVEVDPEYKVLKKVEVTRTTNSK